jgi:hypothetical protein
VKNIIDQIDLTDIYKIFHPTPTKAHGTFSKIDDILGHNTSLNKHKKIKITYFFRSQWSELNQSNRNYRKYTNTWKLNNILLNNQ